MGRKDILMIAVMGLAILVLSIIIMALSPIWITVGVINPNVYDPLTEHLTQNVTRQVMRQMVKGSRF